MRLFGLLLGFVIVTALGAELYVSWKDFRALERDRASLEAKLFSVERDRAKLERELEYLKNPENLEKELRAKFNFKREGEEMIIVVPSQEGRAQ